MSLITQTVKMNITRVWKYYEDLGYEIPKHQKIYYQPNGSVSHKRISVPKGCIIDVNINDVPKNSNAVNVDVDCDCCKKEYSLSWQSYNKVVDEYGKNYCRDCYGQIRMIGDKNPKWNKNKTDYERSVERKYPEYYEFIRKVQIRDNYTCQCCGKKISNPEVHHLDSYDWCIDKRTDIENGICLCSDCHSNFHVNYGWGNNTRAQFEEWIGKNFSLVSNNIEISPTKRVYCIEENLMYNSARDFAYIHNCETSNIYSCCNHKYDNKNLTVLGFHLLWEDEYLKMSEEELIEYSKIKPIKNYDHLKGKNHPNATKVVCLNTLEVFDYIEQAHKKYNASEISYCCQNRYGRKSSGKHPITGEKLKWMYYENYIEKYGESGLIYYQTA